MSELRDPKQKLGPFEFGRKLTLALIQLYRESPCLWDKTHRHYKNTKVTFDAIQAIKNKLCLYNPEITENEIRRRIKTLRGQYRRELNAEEEDAQKSDRRPDDVFEPKLWCYKHLKFLSGEEADIQNNFLDDLQNCNTKANRPNCVSVKIYTK